MKIIWSILPLLFINCILMAQTYQFDLQGHRGCRGLMPENSIPAFKKALEVGVNTLELDVVITKDHKVVVSHEPYFSADFCYDSAGNTLSGNAKKQHNIYELTYDEVAMYDCGTKGNPKFPDQEKVPVSKPLLSEVFDQLEKLSKEEQYHPFRYNIEIKSSERGDNEFHLTVDVFSQLVYKVIRNSSVALKRVTIQSFDFRVLEYWHTNYPDVELAMLVYKDSPTSNLKKVSFSPDIYSPSGRLVSDRMVEYLHQQGIKVIPWTINDPEDMLKLLNMGVDGIITDYPDRAQAFWQNN